ncbi:hypothetical protein U9M48_005186, partial [Paspalum notatum var. saurae]
PEESRPADLPNAQRPLPAVVACIVLSVPATSSSPSSLCVVLSAPANILPVPVCEASTSKTSTQVHRHRLHCRLGAGRILPPSPRPRSLQPPRPARAQHKPPYLQGNSIN